MTSSPVDASQEIMITVVLKRPLHDNGMSLKDYADAVIAGDQPVMSHDDFVYQFGASDDYITLVTDWATANDLTIIDAHSGSSSIKLGGNAEKLATLFNIQLQTVTDDTGRTYHTHTGELTIPTDIDQVVDFVLGFDEQIVFSAHLTSVPLNSTPEVANPNIYIAPVTPPQVATAYKLPAGDGYGGCVGILELTYSGSVAGWNQNDVNLSFNRIGLTPPTIVNYPVDGAAASTRSDAESMLDIYCAGAVVPKAKIVYYVGPNTFQGFYNVILAAAMDAVNRPSALGISWAANESYFGQDLFATAFQAGIAVGMVCFSSSGDSGAANIVPLYPASSAYQISAGGTNIGIVNGNIIGESAWGGGGGGISNFIARPTWQNGLTSQTINSSGSKGTPTALPKRGYPDISAPADPYTGYQFYINSVLYQYGGTSASAPFLAGMITRLNTLLGKRIGFANSIFYANPSAFNDIVIGDNRDGYATGYTTTVGWDAATGLGSPIGSAIYKLFNTGSTFPKQNYGFRPSTTQTGVAYPRKSIRIK